MVGFLMTYMQRPAHPRVKGLGTSFQAGRNSLRSYLKAVMVNTGLITAEGSNSVVPEIIGL